MRPLSMAILLFLNFSCSLPVSKKDLPDLASDSMANDKIRAIASKFKAHSDVCFDITLQMREVELKDIASSNWTLAWVDKNYRYHLMNLIQRDPASIPEKKGDYMMNRFRVCSPEEKYGELQYLLLSPKTLPFPEIKGMKLEWH